MVKILLAVNLYQIIYIGGGEEANCLEPNNISPM